MSEQFKSIETTELVKIANAIRTKTGTTDKISLEDMPAKIAAIEGGTALPELENEGTASDLLFGKQLIDSEGNVVEGTIATKTESNLTVNGATVTVPSGYYATQATKSVAIATQATPSIDVDSSGLITATATQAAGYVAAGTKSATKQLAFQAAKTITPKATSQIAVSSGYYTGGNVTVAGDSNLVAGNIKSGVSIFGVAGSYEGSGGGDTSIEDGLITRTATTYINDRVTSIGNYALYCFSNLTSVSFPVATSIGSYAFYYCSNLTSVSFPAAKYIGSDAFYHCSNLTSVSFPVATSIGISAFAYCSNLTSVSFPVATYIGNFAFDHCSNLTSVSFPVATSIGNSAFAYCSNLTSVSFPVATYIYSLAFRNCSNLTSVSFPAAKYIGNSAFQYCSKLTSIYLKYSAVCTLANSNAFVNTVIKSTTGSIFVPSSLVASYKKTTNWVYFSNRIYGV